MISEFIDLYDESFNLRNLLGFVGLYIISFFWYFGFLLLFQVLLFVNCLWSLFFFRGSI